MDDALHLRHALNQNAHDHRLKTQLQVEIVPLVDTPAFSIFIEPERYSLALTAFPSFYLPDSFNDDDYYSRDFEGGSNPVDETGRPLVAPEFQPSRQTLFVNTLIAGEYLFRARGAQGQHVLISPEHAHEIYSFIVSLGRRLERTTKSTPEDAQLIYRDLRRWLLERTVARDTMSGAEWLTDIRSGIVERLGKLDGPSLALHRLDSMVSDDMLRHAGEALQFGTEIISPDAVLVKQWRFRIERAKHMNRKRPNPHALEADAITMAQLELLNEGWLQNKKLYVLVTNDRGLHRACVQWLSAARAQGEDKPYFLRDPRRYMPVLDTRHGDHDNQVAVVSRVEQSLRQLLSAFSTTDDNGKDSTGDGAGAFPDRHSLANTLNDRLDADSGELQRFTLLLQSQINAVAASWLELLEYSIVDNTDLVASFARAEAITWARALGGVIGNQSRNQANDVAKKFFTLATSSALLRTEVWAFDKRDAPISSNRRRLVTEFDDFKSSAFKGKSLPDAVNELKQKIGARIEELQDADVAERLLVIGCMSLGIGAWAAARNLLEVAVQQNASTLLKREIQFFCCVARRLAAGFSNYEAEYDALEVLLRELLAEAKSTTERLRLLNEILALRLCRVPFSAALRQDFADDVAVALEVWGEIVELGLPGLVGSAESDLAQALFKQFALNTFCLTYYVDHKHIDAPPVMAMTRVIQQMIENSSFAYVREGVHGQIYPKMASFALADGKMRTNLANEIETLAQDTLRSDDEAGILFDIPFVDRTELRTVSEIMTWHIGHAAPD